MWLWWSSLGCHSAPEENPPPPPPVVQPEPTTPDPVSPTGVAVSPPTLPWGLDRRPPNPTCLAPARPRGLGVGFVRQFPNVALVGQTTALVQRRGVDDWWYVVEKDGRIRRFAAAPPNATELVLDIVPEVTPGRELGMLGLAFHPDFDHNGLAYVSYTTTDTATGDLQIVVTRFTSHDGGATLDPASEVDVLRLTKHFENHHGGNVEFGPDGYLYVGIGDGGSAGDATGNGQDLGVLFGKILRIDVDHPRPPLPYGIPRDNPFLGRGQRPEIWAYGFRNPWRWSFDPITGDLWAGDVGANEVEEIDRVVKGGNHGWNVFEGTTCFDPARGCDTTGLVPPVVAYSRDWGNAVVGGLVHHGRLAPAVRGQYLFNDFGGGTVYRVVDTPGGNHGIDPVQWSTEQLVDWTYGNDGETWALGLEGTIWRLQDLPPDPAPPLSPTLSGTGCVDPEDPTRMVEAAIPFSPVQPFWSDGLGKDRWMALPDGKMLIPVAETGDIGFPFGTVLIKEFAENGVRLETRMLVRHPDGWAGYSWVWRADQSDADLLEGSATLPRDVAPWDIPSRDQCLRCHTHAAGFALGPELPQLDVPFTYPSTGRTANQLDTLEHIGVLPPGTARPGPMPARDGPDPVEARARAYLHVNCSPCHRTNGPAPVDLDLTETTPLADSGMCALPEAGDLGVPGAAIVTPGHPEASVLSLRIHALGTDQMPPLGRNTVDEVGAATIDEWIRSLPSCP